MAWKPPRKSISNPITLLESSKSFQAAGQVALSDEISFERAELVLSLKRTLTLSAPVEGWSQEERHQFATDLAQGAANRIDLVVEKGNPEFCFSEKLIGLADNVRTSLAGEVGAAITDLTMERIGFHWRANGREVAFVVPNAAKAKKGTKSAKGTKANEKIPDFVYDPGGQVDFAAGSIAAVEAKGSLSKSGAKPAAIKRLASNAFKEQVAQYLGATASGCIVAAGFAVAYGSAPGSGMSTVAIASSHEFQTAEQPLQAAVSLSAAASGESQQEPQKLEVELEFEEQSQPQEQLRRQEELRRQQDFQIEFRKLHPQEQEELEVSEVALGDSGRGGGSERDRGGPRPRGTPSGRIALANYEAVFQMCGAFAAARLLRILLSGGSIEELEPDDQLQHFHVFDHREEPILTGQHWHDTGIAAASAEEILRIAARPELPPFFELGIVPPERRRISGPGLDATLQGDGLAYIEFWTGRASYRTWDLRKGDWLR